MKALWPKGFWFCSVSYGMIERDYFNFCFKVPRGITSAGVGARKTRTIVIRASCFFLFKGKRLCLCWFLVIFPSWSLFLKGLEYRARGSDGEGEFLAMHPSSPDALPSPVALHWILTSVSHVILHTPTETIFWPFPFGMYLTALCQLPAAGVRG